MNKDLDYERMLLMKGRKAESVEDGVGINKELGEEEMKKVWKD